MPRDGESDASDEHVRSVAALSVLRVDVLPHLKTARFDRSLTYRVPDELQLEVGDVVRVPLGSRDVFAYVLSAPHRGDDSAKLREVIARVDGPRAFDGTGLELARWIADRYI